MLAKVSRKTDRTFLERAVARKWVEDRLAPWCPHTPHDKQLDALTSDAFELFYGGAMSGGKSDCLLMRAAMSVSNPKYRALILRRSFAELMLPGAILHRAKEWWLRRRGVKWDAQNKTFEFPSGALVVFGYCDVEGDEKRYDGTELSEVMFDEVQEFEWSQYSYLFQRIRKTKDSNVKLGMRACGMPGGSGHEWVKERFITHDPADPTKPWRADPDMVPAFVPATWRDNPHIHADYINESLRRLDAFTRRQRGDGDWTIAPDGVMFKASWFRIVKALPPDVSPGVRFWDLARTEKRGPNEPDHTASCRMHRAGDDFYIVDATEDQMTPGTMQTRQVQIAQADGFRVAVRAEEEKAAAGAHLTAAHKRGAFAEYDYDGIPVTGDKITRARPLSIDAEQGRVFLVDGPWVDWWISRMVQFPHGKKDTTDAASGAHFYLCQRAIGVPRGFDSGRRTLTSTLWANRGRRLMV